MNFFRARLPPHFSPAAGSAGPLPRSAYARSPLSLCHFHFSPQPRTNEEADTQHKMASFFASRSKRLTQSIQPQQVASAVLSPTPSHQLSRCMPSLNILHRFQANSCYQTLQSPLLNQHQCRQFSDAKAQVRLSKRMSELGMCSRREAAKILRETTNAKDLMQFKQVIYLRGEPVTAGTGVKIAQDEQLIEIRSADNLNSNERGKSFTPYNKLPWDKICADTVVLNKPVGYVSGQEEHQVR